MYLALFLFPILLISSASSVFREDIPPEVLAGFKHINATEIVESLVPSVKPLPYPTPTKHHIMCAYFYCHSMCSNSYCPREGDHCEDYAYNAMCYIYCGYYVEHAEKELMDQQIKMLNSTEPAGGVSPCSSKCVLNCNESDERRFQECRKECQNLCSLQTRHPDGEKYEREFLELIMRLKKIGAV